MKLTCVTAIFNAINAGNREKVIRCVKSVAAVKTEHEHIMVDGASTDGTLELLQELAGEYPNLKVISGPDTGIYNALNKGLKAATGEWFYVLGCDDYICVPEVMDRLIAEEDPKTQMIVAPVEYDDDPNYAFQRLRDLHRLLRWGYAYCHQGVIMKTELARKCDGFDESFRYCADGDMWMKVHKMCVPFHYTFEFFANFGAGGANETQRRKVLAETERFVVKNFGLTKAEGHNFSTLALVPYRVVHKYYYSKDLALRTSARCLMDFYVRDFFGTIAAFFRRCCYPFVLLMSTVYFFLHRRKDAWYVKWPLRPLVWMLHLVRGY